MLTLKPPDSSTTDDGRRMLTIFLPFTATLVGRWMVDHTYPLHDADPNLLSTIAPDSRFPPPTLALRLPRHLHHREEKSTTKEAMCLLEKCYGKFAAGESNNLEVADAKLTPERRKVCSVCGHSTDQYRKEDEEDVSSQTEEDISAHKSPALSLVKLTGGSLLLFTFPYEDSADTVKIVSDIIDSLGSGYSSSPCAIGVIDFFLSKLHAV